MTLTLKQVKDAIGHHAEVGRRKDGSFIARRGYFYRHGMDADKFAAQVQHCLTQAGLAATIKESGDIWKAFRGSAKTANSSHWFAVIV